jgi:cell division protein FtsL
MPWWAKEKLAENMQREINRDIETLKTQINSQKNFSENIALQIKELLMESLDRIKP